jgi:hypothetical protein
MFLMSLREMNVIDEFCGIEYLTALGRNCEYIRKLFTQAFMPTHGALF